MLVYIKYIHIYTLCTTHYALEVQSRSKIVTNYISSFPPNSIIEPSFSTTQSSTSFCGTPVTPE